jgi:hypothetical protein
MVFRCAERFGYREEDIVMLTDDAKNPRQQPTKDNIVSVYRSFNPSSMCLRIDETDNCCRFTQCNGLCAALHPTTRFSSTVGFRSPDFKLSPV